MKLLRIKWENIISISAGIFYIYCIAKHTITNGFQFETFGLEIIIYSLIWLMTYMTTYYLRQDLKENLLKK